jgi:WhiB family redox-sensing transcriptional regulator
VTWQERGRCRTDDVDPSIFFPGEGERAVVNQARKICFRCPVRVACLQFAVDHGEVGIWGGTTDYERRNMRRSA